MLWAAAPSQAGPDPSPGQGTTWQAELWALTLARRDGEDGLLVTAASMLQVQRTRCSGHLENMGPPAVGKAACVHARVLHAGFLWRLCQPASQPV